MVSRRETGTKEEETLLEGARSSPVVKLDAVLLLQQEELVQSIAELVL